MLSISHFMSDFADWITLNRSKIKAERSVLRRAADSG
jgi:hypothetical protein